ncbi:PROSC [Mytilus edulis]|uniref:Pyridoxal phosphate homeostasis protein n=1 Tax=Mytilus edulis TaxID=6550 RepID=A0A8S3Q6U2_MYTED|nr:PROSC [Mytilus edulis]
MKKSGNGGDKNKFKELKRRTQREIRKAYWNYIDSIVSPPDLNKPQEKPNCMKRFWTFIKHKRMASTSSIQTALKTVNANIQNQISKKTEGAQNVRLVAVTKTKPVEDIITAYECGQRHFGENYIIELEEKTKHPRIQAICREIKWHFIGHVQTNKAKNLAAIPNLYMCETVHSEKLAKKLNKELEKAGKTEKLKVLVQVNTSREENKNGVSTSKVSDLVNLIRTKCTELEFKGLMTIGSFDHSLADGVNPDFVKLLKCRDDVCRRCNLKVEDIELSMGMSHDYEHAVELGSTNVRVGSTIFGARDPPKQSQNQEVIQEKEEESQQYQENNDSQHITKATDQEEVLENNTTRLRELAI